MKTWGISEYTYLGLYFTATKKELEITYEPWGKQTFLNNRYFIFPIQLGSEQRTSFVF